MRIKINLKKILFFLMSDSLWYASSTRHKTWLNLTTPKQISTTFSFIDHVNLIKEKSQDETRWRIPFCGFVTVKKVIGTYKTTTTPHVHKNARCRLPNMFLDNIKALRILILNSWQKILVFGSPSILRKQLDVSVCSFITSRLINLDTHINI